MTVLPGLTSRLSADVNASISIAISRINRTSDAEIKSSLILQNKTLTDECVGCNKPLLFTLDKPKVIPYGLAAGNTKLDDKVLNSGKGDEEGVALEILEQQQLVDVEVEEVEEVDVAADVVAADVVASAR